MSTPIRVLLVDDSPVVLTILKRLLASAPGIEVVGTAHNGRQALDLIPTLQPTVICTDYHMPQMNGLEFIQQVMSRFPRPILVISTSVHPQEDESNVFRLLEAGAVDIFPKPQAGSASDYDRLQQGLINKIKILAGVQVFTRHIGKEKSTPSKQSSSPTNSTVNHQPSFLEPSVRIPHPTIQAIAISVSTGGPQALHTVLTQLPKNLSVPVFCVQHISEGFLQGLVTWLGAGCQLPIKIARAGELPLPGVIYFAPERYHLDLGTKGQFVYSSSGPVDGHCPSVTVLFQAVARKYGIGGIGILLTGMGRDGATGMLDIALAGGITIAQDEQSSVVFGMPREAIALGAAKYVLAIDAIPTLLMKFL
jgi:two-component system chemotaxis response regulator CheB